MDRASIHIYKEVQNVDLLFQTEKNVNLKGSAFV